MTYGHKEMRTSTHFNESIRPSRSIALRKLAHAIYKDFLNFEN